VPADDLRHRILAGYRGRQFRFAKYKPPSVEWDHDHCDVCSARLAEMVHPDIHTYGYVHLIRWEPSAVPELVRQARKAGMYCTEQPTVDGCTQRWICPDCFDQYREEFDFKVEA
jgi:hypothetical protein